MEEENVERKNMNLSPEEVLKKVKSYFNKDRKKIFIITLITGIIVHFLLLSSLITSQDGLMHILHYSAGGYEASLGRWGIDFFDSIRNDIAIPFITTLISITILGFVNNLIIDLFEIKNDIFKILTILVFVSAPGLAMTLLYTYTADVYFWSMFLSVFTVYSFYKIKNKKVGYILGVISFILMLSTYQSYIGITIGLIIMLNIKKLINEKNSSLSVLKDLITKAIILILSAVCYYVITVILLKIWNLEMTSYGGLNTLTVVSMLTSIITSVKDAYLGFIKYFFADGIILNRTWNRDICYITFFVISFVSAIILFIKKVKEEMKDDKNSKVSIEFILRWCFIILLCLLLPVFLNIVLLIAPGNEIYYLTSTQMVLIFTFIFMILELLNLDNKKILVDLINWGIIIITFVIVFTYILSIIVTYQTIEITYNQAKSISTRILMRIEEVPGYRKDMNYLFAGVIDDVNSPKTLDIYNYALTNSLRSSLFHGTYWGQESTWKNFMNVYTGVHINFCTDYEYYTIINSDEFKEMDIFPGENSVKMINDVMVVKFTDTPDMPPLSDNLLEHGISY